MGDGMATDLETMNGPTRSNLEALAASVPWWFHSIDLGQGVVTPGSKSAGHLAEETAHLRLPELAGKSVLDIGAWNGYYSFHAEKCGAARVVALDHLVWATDLTGWAEDAHRRRASGLKSQDPRETPFWRPEELPGKRGFDIAASCLGSRVEAVANDFETMDLGPLGTFDVVLYLGVLYHSEDPVRSLRRLRAVTAPGGVAVIETEAFEDPPWCGRRPLWEFYPFAEPEAKFPIAVVEDTTNWWGPNLAALIGLCRATGFGKVEVVKGPPYMPGSWRPKIGERLRQAVRYVRRGGPDLYELDPARSVPVHYRAIVHARCERAIRP
jgi:tRNA (mo5U34)-methyltransferase